MIMIMIAIFVIGYGCIALEHKIKIDKAATALFMFGLIWSVYALHTGDVSNMLVEHLGTTCETLIFLIGAMTIVEIIDTHGGFSVITRCITSRNKYHLLWLLSILTFFLSAVLDNMTTTIIMVMLLRRIIPEKTDRLLFAAVIIIAANSGGAWSPIGDVTTIMLWMQGNVNAAGLVGYLFLPSVVSLLIPTYVVARKFRNAPQLSVADLQQADNQQYNVGPRVSRGVLLAGVLSLLFVPVFKSVVGLPPYVGIMLSLGAMWILIEILYDRKDIEEDLQNRVSKVLHRIDMSTILFFLGILMSVAGLQSAGILSSAADFLDKNVHEVFTIASTVGILSSIVDNVPLVAACMGMYPVADEAMIVSAADPQYMQLFAENGLFWLLLTYCAGVGGSLLIIGSAAGVVAMGLEKIDFSWYLKNISLVMLLGYFAGVLVIFIESLIFM